MELERLSKRKSSCICLRMLMKNQFLKSVLVFGTVLTLTSCSDEATNAVNSLKQNAIVPEIGSSASALPAVSADDPCWLLNADQTYLVYPAGVVTDANGSVIATVTFVEGSFIGTITTIDGRTIFNEVDVSGLPLTSLSEVIATMAPTSSATTILESSASELPALSSASEQPILSSANELPGLSSANVEASSSSNGKTSSSSNAKVESSSSEKNQTQSSSSEAKQPAGKITVTGSLTQTVAKGGSISKVTFSGVESEPQRSWTLHFLQANYDKNAKTYTIEGSVPDYWDQAKATEEITIDGQKFSLVLTLSGASTAKSSSSTVKSSSSQQQPKSSSSFKSSSSSAKSSSSVASSSSVKSSSSQNTNASAEEAKYLNAGAGGQQGFATRYWDCCMPHCAWPEHGGAAKTCDAKGKTPISNNSGSICSSGQGTTCTSQIPIIVSDKLAYAFAATPGNDATCGKCFALTFTGEGKYETKANHQALKGKTLVVMASNIGYDVQGGQFDVMIPGGGVGAFNGCANMGWGDQGAQYGGLLSKCEDEVGYDGDLLNKRKECLKEKCNKSFANDEQAKEGCMFLATWMEAAGNPNHTYKEVECPAALKAQF